MFNISDSIMEIIKCTSFYKIIYNKTLNRKYDISLLLRLIILILENRLSCHK